MPRGLAPIVVRQVMAVIGTIASRGIGVLLVEHHTDFVFSVCDRVTVLDLGKMIAHGAPGDVRTDPDVVRVYLGA